MAGAGTGFHNPALDRNAASHIAFGPASTIHIDCAVGTATMNVDGILATGHVETIMRDGQFTI
jgi:leucyl aminopeptidase (aminopeptidase T)